jgi:hypothetical protein
VRSGTVGEVSPERAENGLELLSVVMPIRDDGRHVEALLRYWDSALALGSIAGDVSFVLVDESSSAAPVERLATSLTEAGFPARICRQVPARGPGHARGLGLGLVASDFVCFLDVDDRPDLEQFVAAAEVARDEALDVVALEYVVEVGSRVVERGEPPRMSHFWEDLLSRRLGVWRFVYRVDFLRDARIRFPEWDYAEDLAFLVQCAERASRVGYLPAVGYTYALHGDGLSGRRPSGAQAARAVTWLQQPGPRQTTSAGRYLRALWLARIAMLGGWRTAPRALSALPQLVRHPLRVGELAGRSVRSRWTRHSSSTRGERS